MDGNSRVTRDSVRRALVAQMEKNADTPSVFMDELAHLITDMNDYQLMSKKISKGNSRIEKGVNWGEKGCLKAIKILI